MDQLISHIQIQVNSKIFLKDPQSSELGKRILQHGIELIDEMGLESFTFRKLAKKLETTESSIYRYFESKHKLLLYLISLYWGWQEYRLVFSTNNIEDPCERLKAAINSLTSAVKGKTLQGCIDLEMLSRVIIAESPKAYLTKEVDEANKEGFFAGYKRLVHRITAIIQEITPEFAFPKTLASTIVEGIYHQKYFAAHLPSLTDIQKQSSSEEQTKNLTTFYTQMALSTIQL